MVGGGILSKRTGTLSGDGKLLLCPCGRLVHIYSAVTGERVGSLVGHTAEVTGVILDPENGEQVYTCSNDASVRLWDYRAGEELRRITVREPVKHMFSGTAMKTRFAGPLALSTSPGCGSLAATIDRHSLFVWRTGNDIYQPLNLHHTKPYTCLAISADDSLIAAGDASGRILLWRAFEHSVPSALRDRGGQTGGKAHPAVAPPLTTLHWHAHPVGCLSFSPDACVAVYNLLTAAVHWCLPYGAVSLSADAAHGLLAVALPVAAAPRPPTAAADAPAAADGGAEGAAAASAAAAEPASTSGQQHPPHHGRHHRQSQPAPSCHVLVLDPRDGTPRYHCHVPGARHVHLAHLRGAAAAAGGGGGDGGGCSPLLVLRDNRQYTVAALPGSHDGLLEAPTTATLEKEADRSAFEDIFGRTEVRQAVAPMDVDGDGGDVPYGHVGGRRPWAELFDAPSHVLPPPSALASAFLTSLLTTTADA
ncbi:hypothetical protein GPECTOR_54g239 [Gonium pectorale]|uniref:Uncharacterized protein n=1 Tax=Gonium pectorale TaxID=33097 RepID=A0A150G6M2_GONPE|nr:hypothetical protein GPECTOR_54g239 [Gonium pectorale]|eukprot:KXZ45497.1 hypothetical protein GPECTOR_54g239 [Gonium pectorale]